MLTDDTRGEEDAQRGSAARKEFGEGPMALPESFAVCVCLLGGLTGLGRLAGFGALRPFGGLVRLGPLVVL